MPICVVLLHRPACTTCTLGKRAVFISAIRKLSKSGSSEMILASGNASAKSTAANPAFAPASCEVMVWDAKH